VLTAKRKIKYMIDKAKCFQQFIDYSVKEEGFSFLGGGDEFAEPQRMTSRMQFLLEAATSAAAYSGFVGGGYMKGSLDNAALVADLRKMLDCADVIGIRLKDGLVVLKLGIDADNLPGEALVGRFAIITERTVKFREYACAISRFWNMKATAPISQGVVVLSDPRKAQQFIEEYGDKCKHSTFWKNVYTQPWVVDLHNEKITRCGGLRRLMSTLPLDSEKARAGFFHKRGP
jgi:hypothetical protein